MFKSIALSKADIVQLWPSVLLMVIMNLIPVAGVIWFDWSVFALIVLFWMENIIIGFYNLPRIVLAGLHGEPDKSTTQSIKTILFSMIFFTVHYGFFTYGHGLFVFAKFGDTQPEGMDYRLQDLWSVVNEYGLWMALTGLFISHGFSFVTNYVLKQQYRTLSIKKQMVQPYHRIVLLHFTILIGAFLIERFDTPLAGLVFLVLLKIYMDVKAHIKQYCVSSSNRETSTD